ncbi:hypothetical protein ACFE04_018666 [Oxalis oulophora]
MWPRLTSLLVVPEYLEVVWQLRDSGHAVSEISIIDDLDYESRDLSKEITRTADPGVSMEYGSRHKLWANMGLLMDPNKYGFFGYFCCDDGHESFKRVPSCSSYNVMAEPNPPTYTFCWRELVQQVIKALEGLLPQPVDVNNISIQSIRV